MRPDEEEALKVLADALNTEYAEGEDPPDGYVMFEGKKVAVEVTQMVEQTTRENGQTQSRLGEDLPALKVIEQLNEAVSNYIPENKSVLVILPSPVRDVRKTKKEMISMIKDMIDNDEETRDLTVKTNEISISVFRQTTSRDNKIQGAISNQNSSPNIGGNAAGVLRDRIAEKEKRRRDSSGTDEYWLLLINQYWMADNETFLNAYNTQAPIHRFNRIYTVDDQKSLYRLC